MTENSTATKVAKVNLKAYIKGTMGPSHLTLMRQRAKMALIAVIKSSIPGRTSNKSRAVAVHPRLYFTLNAHDIHSDGELDHDAYYYADN